MEKVEKVEEEVVVEVGAVRGCSKGGDGEGRVVGASRVGASKVGTGWVGAGRVGAEEGEAAD